MPSLDLSALNRLRKPPAPQQQEQEAQVCMVELPPEHYPEAGKQPQGFKTIPQPEHHHGKKERSLSQADRRKEARQEIMQAVSEFITAHSPARPVQDWLYWATVSEEMQKVSERFNNDPLAMDMLIAAQEDLVREAGGGAKITEST